MQLPILPLYHIILSGIEDQEERKDFFYGLSVGMDEKNLSLTLLSVLYKQLHQAEHTFKEIGRMRQHTRYT